MISLKFYKILWPGKTFMINGCLCIVKAMNLSRAVLIPAFKSLHFEKFCKAVDKSQKK